MTLMFATVTGPAEAEVALAAGADVIDLADVSDPPLGRLDAEAVRRTVEAVAGRCRLSAAAGNTAPAEALAAVRELAGSSVEMMRVAADAEALRAVAGEARLIAVLFADRGQDFDLIEQLAASGFAGAMLDTADKGSGSLLEHVAPGWLADFVGRCRASGLLAGFAGGLEAPDVPRLLALKPDFLRFRRALCRNEGGGIDAEAVAAIRGLIANQDEPARPQRAGGAATPFDRVLVRDLVLPVSIGAYGRERGKPQRVRFAVTAEVAPRAGGGASAGDHMGAVFSYDVIVDAIRALVEDRHVTLVETLAEEIAAKVLDSREVQTVTVRVEKLDVGPAVVGIEIVRRARE